MLKKIKPYYLTQNGSCYNADSLELLQFLLDELKGKVQLVLTSPPFPLNHKKQYGNMQGDEYISWLNEFAPLLSQLLKPDGSIVIELGNAWEPKRPVQSLLPLKALLSFVQHPQAELRLCQEFICHNAARLPSPAQWVTRKRCRLTDSYTHIWWMSKNDFPKADNRNILRPYSKSMKKLQSEKTYNSGKRPSGHVIGEKTFLVDNGGSIMPNAIEITPINSELNNPRLPSNAFNISNTNSNDYFHRICREKDITPHPARMPLELVDFFVKFLTDPGDLVLDPFAGSNTTGFCAEKYNRKWFSIEIRKDYVKQSMLRFGELNIKFDRKRMGVIK